MVAFAKLFHGCICHRLLNNEALHEYSHHCLCEWPFNPLLPSAANMRRSAKILILILEGIIKKITYERRDYESVDEKSLS